MKIKAGNYCPLLQKECIGLQCAWITQIRGMDPQTGEDVDEWDCAIKWLPFLLIENTKKNIEIPSNPKEKLKFIRSEPKE